MTDQQRAEALDLLPQQLGLQMVRQMPSPLRAQAQPFVERATQGLIEAAALTDESARNEAATLALCCVRHALSLGERWERGGVCSVADCALAARYVLACRSVVADWPPAAWRLALRLSDNSFSAGTRAAASSMNCVTDFGESLPSSWHGHGSALPSAHSTTPRE